MGELFIQGCWGQMKSYPGLWSDFFEKSLYIYINTIRTVVMNHFESQWNFQIHGSHLTISHPSCWFIWFWILVMGPDVKAPKIGFISGKSISWVRFSIVFLCVMSKHLGNLRPKATKLPQNVVSEGDAEIGPPFNLRNCNRSRFGQMNES